MTDLERKEEAERLDRVIQSSAKMHSKLINHRDFLGYQLELAEKALRSYGEVDYFNEVERFKKDWDWSSMGMEAKEGAE